MYVTTSLLFVFVYDLIQNIEKRNKIQLFSTVLEIIQFEVSFNEEKCYSEESHFRKYFSF